MNTLEKQMMITQILTDNGWEVTDISMTGRCEIKANKRWSNISIYTEECMCHGGRMWINEKHTKTNYEISHPEYDESLGITDSSTELEWIIKNEMMEYVNKLSKMVYKLVKINEYGQSTGHDKEDTTYFSSMESLAYRVTDGEDIKDILINLKSNLKYMGIISSNTKKNINNFLKNENIDNMDFIISSPLFSKEIKINKIKKKLKLCFK